MIETVFPDPQRLPAAINPYLATGNHRAATYNHRIALAFDMDVYFFHPQTLRIPDFEGITGLDPDAILVDQVVKPQPHTLYG